MCTNARLAVLAAIARHHAPRLELAADRAGGNLAIHVLARQPDLDVVGLLRGKAHVAGAERDDAVVQARAAAGFPRRSSACARARPWTCSGVVMETSSTLVNWCWRIMPRVSLPAAPASARKHGVQAVSRMRQRGFVDDGFADEIGQRHFGGGDEPRWPSCSRSSSTRTNPSAVKRTGVFFGSPACSQNRSSFNCSAISLHSRSSKHGALRIDHS